VVTIVGAGLAGLISAHVLVRRHRLRIIESQSVLPDNHGALLRFRSDAVSQATGIPFKKVHVRKAIGFDGKLYNEATPLLANLYSLKVTGSILDRSCWDLNPVDRYIAPDDFIPRLVNGVQIQLGTTLTFEMLKAIHKEGGPIISTIPMPALMAMVGWPHKPQFEHHPIWSISGTVPVPCDVYQTIYFPGDTVHFYRASMVGSRMIVETRREPMAMYYVPDSAQQLLRQAGMYFGIDQEWKEITTKRQEYGKIVPIADPEEGREFIYIMSQELGLYSVGRFALWRQLLLDDIVHDIQVVERLISAESSRKHYQKALQRLRDEE
jgi:hypothetical protein